MLERVAWIKSGMASFRVPCGVAGRPNTKLGVGLAIMACISFSAGMANASD